MFLEKLFCKFSYDSIERINKEILGNVKISIFLEQKSFLGSVIVVSNNGTTMCLRTIEIEIEMR
jgi:hypothetical protein